MSQTNTKPQIRAKRKENPENEYRKGEVLCLLLTLPQGVNDHPQGGPFGELLA